MLTRNKQLIFNLQNGSKKYAWSPYNDKRIEEPHDLFERIFIVSEETGQVRPFFYFDFLNKFKIIQE